MAVPDAPVWLSTLFTFLLLRSTGADLRSAIDSAVARLETSLCWNDLGGCWDLRPAALGGNPFFLGEVEPCINGGVLALGASFGRPNESLANRPSTISSRTAAGTAKRQKVCAPHSIQRSAYSKVCWSTSAPLVLCSSWRRPDSAAKSTCSIVGSSDDSPLVRSPILSFLNSRSRLATTTTFSAHWTTSDSPRKPDPRIRDAVHLIESRRQPDGRWLLDHAYDEALAVPVGESIGEPSRWNTLRALRVLRCTTAKGPSTNAS